jgi:RNA-directed DNA polymerase
MQETPAMKAKVTTTVPPKATQAGKTPDDQERRSRWSWAEASIWTDRMLAALETGVKGGCWFSLIDKVYSPKNLWWTPMAGAPQGAVLSPLLSNIYLNPLDHLMASGGYEMVRYADDFVILCRTKEDAESAALAEVKQWTAQAGLSLHPEKTRLIDTATEGFEFLGYRFHKGRRDPRHKSKLKLRATIRHKTRRANGVSLETTIKQINPVLRGWYGYFKHASKGAMREVDGWVRMRLRSILRKRQNRRGPGRGADHQRWPNAYFARAGLFSLNKAHELARQSMKMAQ